MDSKKIVELALDGKSHEIKLDAKLQPLAQLLWYKTIESIESIPKDINPIHISDKTLEQYINTQLMELNAQSATQKQKYEVLISELIKYE